MSIDSGGKTASLAKETLEKKINEEKIEDNDEELEDGELDSEDDEPAQTTVQPAKKQPENSTSKSTQSSKSSIKSNSIKDDRSNQNQSSKNKHNHQTNRKRRRSGSADSEESLDGKRNKRSSNFNRNKQINRNKRASTDDEEQDSDDENYKIDQKMMFNMLKKMQDFLMNNKDKSNKQNTQECDKFLEKFKNSKSGHKEMIKFFKKNEKMMNQSSQDHPLFNSQFNQSNPFQNGPPMNNNMFGGIPNMNPSLLGGPPFQNYGPPPGGPFNHPHGPPPPQFNQGPPGLLHPPGPPNHHMHPQQLAAQQQQANLNDLALASQSLTSTSSNANNKKQKKRNKKQKDDKDDLFNDDQQQIPKQQICKYFLEGHCQKGNDCDFMHQQPFNYKREVCKFYLQDSCGKGEFWKEILNQFNFDLFLLIKFFLNDKGDNCTFLHKEFPCKFHHTGQDCIMGENCKFNHEPISNELRDIFLNYMDNAELNEELNIAYGLSKNQQKKPPILGDIPEEVKNSYHTWVWQQEMKKLELAYTGTKRNLFCIDDQFVLKEEPDKDGYEDDLNEFSRDIDERQSNFYIDTHGDQEDDNMNLEDEEDNEFPRDYDLRKETNQLNELKTLDEVKKQWLDEESDDGFESKKANVKEEKEESINDKQKSVIDISKMLDAIRQTTTPTENQSQTNQTSSDTSTSDKNQEFWRSILDGVNLNDSNNKSLESESSTHSHANKSSSSQQQPPPQIRDPRLARQRNSTQQQNKLSQQFISQSSSSVYKIPADEPFSWSIGDITFKLYKIDVDKIDYSSYKCYYDADSKSRSDPRLENFFTNNYSNSQSSIIPPIISSTDILPPLTLSSNYSKKTESSIPSLLSTERINTEQLFIPPAPTSNLSSLDLISPSRPSVPNSQLSFQEQILASVNLPKKVTIPEAGGLGGLADLVSEKSKKVNG